MAGAARLEIAAAWSGLDVMPDQLGQAFRRLSDPGQDGVGDLRLVQRKAVAEWYGRPRWLGHRLLRRISPGLHAGSAGWLASFERAIMGSLAKVHRRASGCRTQAVTPAEAALATIYSSINAAYVVGEMDHAHELLALAAWLGHLVRGQAAYLPLVLAGRLADELDRLEQDASGCGATRVVRWHLALAGGSSSLERATRRTLATGRPSLCRGRDVDEVVRLASKLAPDVLAPDVLPPGCART